MLDDIDRSLVAALSHDGRMPFTEVAGLLGVSSQTVARRFGRLQDRAGLRVVGQVRPGLVGRAQRLLRVGAEPRVAQRVAVALSGRAETSWVSVVSGGLRSSAWSRPTRPRPILAALGRDGRVGLAELSARTGRSADVVARRLRELRDDG